MSSSQEAETAESLSTPPNPPKLDREACKKGSKRTPNDRVWAHRISDLRSYSGRYWSPSMAKIAGAQHNLPSYLERLFDADWQQYDEPDPRKLRVWPVLTVQEGVECNDELLALKDERGKDCSSKDGDVSTDEKENLNAAVPKLEQRIATHLLPEILIVDDCSVPPIGQGSHADVYQAHLTLDERFQLVAQPTQPPTVRVAAKIPYGNQTDLGMLEHEARMYNAFPQYLSEDWSGFNAIGEAFSPSLSEAPLVSVTAVVPKFYGYFVPDEQLDGARPILLMEECGNPIEPESLSPRERMICFVFPHTLYNEGFIQNSFYARNILVQPGPLTHPPDQRSLKTPSFRVIDFGRCKSWDDLLGDRIDAVAVQKTRFSEEVA
ncbi:hypothetical protein MSAN_01721200 [Mycena sanguinolenta]|uniref:Protein kinase domain-containing protein n=1 Tax=Mycena sanguinolenta TaxID=230812 RepID=A0A8H7CV25_9AGAR|nr:hypothetical protein MSAN_01721200 [Mycena sanguinolenta]